MPGARPPPPPSIQCIKIALGGYAHTMVQASLTVQTAADGRSYHLAHHTRRWIRPITRPSARGPRGPVPTPHALTNLTRYSAVTHMVVQGRDTHATDRCRWAFLRSIVHMRRGNWPSLLACAPGMMPQGASSVRVAAVVCSWRSVVTFWAYCTSTVVQAATSECWDRSLGHIRR